MIDMLDMVLDKFEIITGITGKNSRQKFDYTKILINKDGKLSDDITLKSSAILVTCVLKDGSKFNLKLFFEEASYDEHTQRKAIKEI